MPQNIDELLIAKCGECIYFSPLPHRTDGLPTPDAIKGAGQCRYDAPTLIGCPHCGNDHTSFPQVHASHWCGKFVRVVVDKPTELPVIQFFTAFAYKSFEEASRDHAE